MSSHGSSPMKLDMYLRRTVLAIALSLFACTLWLLLELKEIVPPGGSLTLAVGLVSALFHVIYSYVSTGMVLTKISVVSHAVANILKRVLVVLLLYAFGQRVASISNFLGLVCCTVGLFVYVWDKIRQGNGIMNTGLQGKSFFLRSLGSIKMLPRALIAVVSVLAVLSIFASRGKVDVRAEHPHIRFYKPVSGQRKLFQATNTTVHEGGKYFSRNTFLVNGMQRPTNEELYPILDDFHPQKVADIKSFLKSPIMENPKDVNFLSEKLTQTSEVIREAQRLHFNVLEGALKKYKYSMLFDMAAFENKGDPCITVGEKYFLERINLEIIYYCTVGSCGLGNMKKAKILADTYPIDEVVILVHGGGNIIGYPGSDYTRFHLLTIFSEYAIFVFPQSIWMADRNSPHVEETIKNYCCHSNLTIVLRDLVSYGIAKELYQGSTRLLMAPDMAFQIGRVERFMSPVFDILWLKRSDGETPGYGIPDSVPNNLRVHVSDWWKWLTPKAGSHLEKAFYIAANGFFFLQRGRVVVTDRLHGHILSTLMDIPHVVIDNKYKKLSGYHNTWTRSVENTILTYDPSQALDLAIGLLQKYNDTLPPTVNFLDMTEDFNAIEHGKPIVGYP